MSAIIGTNLNDKLHGTGSSDLLDGMKGADQMTGGLGNDTYIVDNAGDVVVEYANQGHDRVQSSVSYTLAVNVEDLKLVGTANLNAAGNDLDNVITGNDGMNTIDGGTGADTMSGGKDWDTYFVDNVGDKVIEAADSHVYGMDTVQSSISITKLFDNVEYLGLLGTADLTGNGNDLDNAIAGNSGANHIDGGLGADKMSGNGGDDTYVVDNAKDWVYENAGEGTDTVLSTVTHLLEANVENLTLLGGGNISALGNALDNILIGSAGNNTLSGGAGNDTMKGGAGDDTYVVDSLGDKVIETPSAGNDTVFSSINFSLAGLDNVENLHLTGTTGLHGIGNDLANTIQGSSGDDVIDGGAGADVMSGGLGGDTYYVDNAGDIVNESAGQGIDVVMSSVALTHGFANVETYEFSTASAVHFTANSLDNMVIGGSAGDVIDGGAGNDFLYGKDGNDTLTGGAGIDHLYGDAGADVMNGGSGGDTYFIDAQDTVIEAAGGGEDSVVADFSLTNLFANVEEAFLSGTGNIDVHGNALNNVLWGNDANNTIDGDIGNDMINGRGGNDVLIGGKGADTFMFDMVPTGAQNPQNDGNDTIQDFVKAQDVLSFDHVQDHNNDGNITLSDLLSSVSSVVDHGAGQSVDVTFENGSSISFAGAGTGHVDHITDLVTNAATQIHVS